MKNMTRLLNCILTIALSVFFQFANAQSAPTNEQEETNTVVSCNCSKIGYGCFATDWTCKFACAYKCHHHITGIYSDPLSNSTIISLSLEQSENISTQIYDVSGRLIKVLSAGEMSKGEHQLQWNATNENGTAVCEGIYLLRISSPENSETIQLSVMN